MASFEVGPYEVGWTTSAKRSLARLPEKIATAVIEFCYGALSENPHRVGKKLRFEMAGLHSARRGDFRVIYRINEPGRRIDVVAIEHRSDVYRPR